ncbi:MAG: tRNA (N6-isopentenyl adenosine(37)-C2)-methylthiotransferase MiaB [Endomicrobia bacterium]|nr:tRNA (N6-isopentenyl adenosine(37)-C2)-methylthiotransferase MiaB [Endomicrobiia bacterium]
METQKLFIKTFGCQMNVADSEYIASMLITSGNFEITQDITLADVIIVNTCSVRQHAEDRAQSFIGKLKKLKTKTTTSKNSAEKPKIVVIGCFAQRAKFELQKRFPFIDIIAGPLDYEYLPEMLNSTFDLSTTTKSKLHLNLFNKISVFVPIMSGCDNFCSYCVVPYLRGREKSRDPEDVLQEVKALLDLGVREIVLVGQNVNSYIGQVMKVHSSQSTFYSSVINNETETISFANLLELVANLNTTQKFWIRFLTNHPKDMNYDIVKVIKKYPNISRHIHLPLQSGSNRILQLMNRNYTVEKYKEIVQMIRYEIPEISITTDLIVGFPTETEEDFKKTMQAVEELQFDSAFVFKYSPRQGTKAAELPDDIPKQTKERRHFELLKLCDDIARNKNKRYFNTIQEVLIISQTNKNNLLAKTLSNKTVEVKTVKQGKLKPGIFTFVKITGVKKQSLAGSILTNSTVSTT